MVVPARPGSRSGNRVTAQRWAKLLRGLGHGVVLTTSWRAQTCDVLVALHARRTAASIRRWRRARPKAPLVVALTGTDQYVDLPRGSRTVEASLDAATRIVALQPRSRAGLPPKWRDKTRVVPHSADAPRARVARAKDAFLVAQLAHLRPVKDPFLAARAVRALPTASRVRVVLAGAALSPAMARRAREEARRDPRRRWVWLGELSRAAALRLVARARLLVLTSKAEGAPNVLFEALAAGTPVLATRIDGVIGVLGGRHPGLFPPGDAAALTELLRRAEDDPRFLAALRRAGEARASRLSPAREREAWRRLLSELAPRGKR